MKEILSHLTWNRVAFLATIVLYCVLTVKGQEIPATLKSALDLILGGGIVGQALSGSIAKKKEDE